MCKTLGLVFKKKKATVLHGIQKALSMLRVDFLSQVRLVVSGWHRCSEWAWGFPLSDIL